MGKAVGIDLGTTNRDLKGTIIARKLSYRQLILRLVMQ